MLIEQAAPSAQFPPLQRNLDQLEALSKKLKAKTLRTEAPSQSIAATRLLAREGFNAEQLARDLKSFELKTTFEDVFPAEATTVEDIFNRYMKWQCSQLCRKLRRIILKVSIALCGLFWGKVNFIDFGLGDFWSIVSPNEDVSPQERVNAIEQQTVLRQLEAILAIHQLARSGNQLDALREIGRLPFLHLDPRAPDLTTTDAFNHLSPHVESCVPGLLKDALHCLDNTTDTDGSLRTLRAKIANFLANNLNRNWPPDLYEKVAPSL